MATVHACQSTDQPIGSIMQDAELKAYVECGEGIDRAGGFAIQVRSQMTHLPEFPWLTYHLPYERVLEAS
jgi:hypothetical protein